MLHYLTDKFIRTLELNTVKKLQHACCVQFVPRITLGKIFTLRFFYIDFFALIVCFDRRSHDDFVSIATLHLLV